MKLNPQAIYCLNEAIIKLHEVRHVDEKTADELRELADEVQAIKGWSDKE